MGIFDFGINGNETRYLISMLTVIVGYSIAQPFIKDFITETIPLNGFLVGTAIILVGLWIFKLK